MPSVSEGFLPWFVQYLFIATGRNRLSKTRGSSKCNHQAQIAEYIHRLLTKYCISAANRRLIVKSEFTEYNASVLLEKLIREISWIE
jgi:hypothetical protein